jgi:hypothetical protein
MQLKKAIDAGLAMEHAFLADPQAIAPSVPSKIAALPKRKPMPDAAPSRPWRRALLVDAGAAFCGSEGSGGV